MLFKMRLLFLIGFLILCVEAEFDEYGYTLDSPADKIKDNPGKCFAEDVGLIDKGTEIKVSGKCQKIECLEGGKYKLKMCHPLAVEPPCYAVYPDTTFPECCKFKIECLSTPSPPTPRRRPSLK